MAKRREEERRDSRKLEKDVPSQASRTEKHTANLEQIEYSLVNLTPDWYIVVRELTAAVKNWEVTETALYPERAAGLAAIADVLASVSPVKLLVSEHTRAAFAENSKTLDVPQSGNILQQMDILVLQQIHVLHSEVDKVLKVAKEHQPLYSRQSAAHNYITKLQFLLDFLNRLETAYEQREKQPDGTRSARQEWVGVNTRIRGSRFYELSLTGRRAQSLLALHSEEALLKRENAGVSAADILGVSHSEQSQGDPRQRRRAQTLQFLKLLRKIPYTDVFWPRIVRSLYVGKQDLETPYNQFEARAMLGAHQTMADIAIRLLLPSLITVTPELQTAKAAAILADYPAVQPDREFDGAFAEALANTPNEFALEFLEAVLVTFTQTDAVEKLVEVAALKKVAASDEQQRNPFADLAARLRESLFPESGVTPPEVFWRKLMGKNSLAFEVDLSTRLLPRSLDAAERPYREASHFFARNMEALLSVIPDLIKFNTEEKLAGTFMEHVTYLLGTNTTELLNQQVSQLHEVSHTMLRQLLESRAAELAYFEEAGHRREIIFAENDWMRQLGLQSLLFTQEKDGSASFALTALDNVSSQLYGIVRIVNGELEVKFNEPQASNAPGIHALLELCVAAFYTDLITRRRIAPELTVKQPIRRGLAGTAQKYPVSEERTASSSVLKRLIRTGRITAPDAATVVESTTLADDVERHARGGERAPHAVSPHPRWLQGTERYQELVKQYLEASKEQKESIAVELATARTAMSKMRKDPTDIPAYIREELGTITDPITQEVFFLKTWVARYFVPAVTPEESQDVTRLYDRFKTPSNCTFLNLLRDVFLRDVFARDEK